MKREAIGATGLGAIFLLCFLGDIKSHAMVWMCIHLVGMLILFSSAVIMWKAR
jgi:hypothetical protein